jgi:hypothetical protein
MSFGFFDLGRFAGDYRQLLGEQPSETLHRARNIARGVGLGSKRDAWSPGGYRHAK